MKLFLLAILLTFPPAFAAEKAAIPAAPGKVANSDNKPAAESSVEQVVAKARGSLVVISHFGRDGEVDGVGSGFVIASDGLIATCLHVIGEARAIRVQFADGRQFDVTEVYASDRKLDLAVIRIAATELPVLPLAEGNTLKQGQPVIAIGHPRGLEHSVVNGVVSAIREFENTPMIQLAMPIEPGNSGGPLLDFAGRVHGLLTLKAAFADNLGFATPVNALHQLLANPNPVPMARWMTIGALDPKRWKPVFGAHWSQRAGRILVEGQGASFGGRSLCLAEQPVPDVPYEIAVTVKLSDESGAAGLAFAADGKDKHYGFYATGGQLRLTRFDGPSVFNWSILEQVHSPSYRAGDWNTLKVRVETNRVLCFVNGQRAISSEKVPEIRGQAGLAKFRQTKAEFKRFELGRKIESAETPDGWADFVSAQIERLAVSDQPDSKLIGALEHNAEATRAVLAEKTRTLEQRARQLRKLAETVHRREIEEELSRVLAGSDEKLDLFSAALLVAKLDDAELDRAAYEAELREMFAEISSKLPAKATSEQKLKGLNDFLFVQNGFHGSRTDYENRANSFVNRVLDDREGIPISLSIIYLELGRRLGIEGLAGVSLPRHFMVGVFLKKGPPQLIDVFAGGKRLSRAEAAELAGFEHDVLLKEEDVKPATNREIILRLIRNLIRNDSVENPLPYLDLYLSLEPNDVLQRANRGKTRLDRGDTEGAKEDFKWLLDQQPAGVDVELLEKLYRSL